MKTTFGRRVTLLGLLVLLFLLVYGAARSYSYGIVHYVVEQSLLQKTPAGTSAAMVQERFRTALSATPERYKLLKLMALSSYLEKVQKLTPMELDQLLEPGWDGTGAGY